jgi:hypothetical protein
MSVSLASDKVILLFLLKKETYGVLRKEISLWLMEN